ncbi:hypothetical protein MTO96_035257 [Rhipicephalus appendiculatus]
MSVVFQQSRCFRRTSDSSNLSASMTKWNEDAVFFTNMATACLESKGPLKPRSKDIWLNPMRLSFTR